MTELTELFERALLKADREKVQSLLEDGMHPDTVVSGSDGKTLLMRAICVGNRDIVRLLLDAGADVTKSTEGGRETALHKAAKEMFARTDLVSLLIDHGADVHGQDRNGNTPLHTAAYFGKWAIMTALVDRGAHMDGVNLYGETPLMRAAMRLCNSVWMGSSGRDAFLGLVNSGADLNLRSIQDMYHKCNTVLSVIVREGSNIPDSVEHINPKELVKALLAAGAQPGEPERDAMIEVLYKEFYTKRKHHRLREERAEILEILLRAGMPAGGEYDDYRGTLLEAICVNHTAGVQELRMALAHGADEDINARHAYYGSNTPLQVYLKREKGGKNLPLEGLRLLLEHGADPNAVDGYGKFPLDIAVEHGFDRHAELLRDYGAMDSATACAATGVGEQPEPDATGAAAGWAP